MVCNTTADPAFVGRTEEIDKGGWLARMIRFVNEKAEAAGLERRELTQQLEEYRVLLGQMLPMNFDELTQYFIDQGWMRVDKKASKALGEDVINVGFRGDWVAQTKEVRNVLAATKTYLESVGGGVNEAARQFIMRVEAGEDALDSAMFFAGQMQHVANFGRFVLQIDQQLGRALQMQGIRKGLPFERITRAAQSGIEPDEAAYQFTEGFLEGVARKMKSGDRIQTNEAIADLLDMAKRLKYANDPRAAIRISSSSQMASNVFKELWYNSLLSSPTTLVTNALGFTWAVARPLSQWITAEMYLAAGLPVGRQGAMQAAMEASAALTAMGRSFMDAWKVGWMAFRDDKSLYSIYEGSHELLAPTAITGKAASEFAAKAGMQLPETTQGAIDTFGHFVRVPSKFLLGADEFTKHLVIRAEVAKRGVRRAFKSPGFDLEDAAAIRKAIEAEELLAFRHGDPDTRQFWKIRENYEYARAIRDEALYATFQQNNALADNFSKVLQTPVIGPIMRPFFPFVRTPLNILKEGFIDSTPLGLLVKSGELWADSGATLNPAKAVLGVQKQIMDGYMEDPGAAFQMAGQISMTMTIVGGLYAAAMSGQVTGGGPGRWHPDRPNAWKYQQVWEKALAEQGKTKYSIAGMPFDRFGEPISVLLRMVADMAEYSSYMTQEEQDASMAALVGLAASGLYQASFLQGLNTLTDAFIGEDPGSRRKVKAAQDWAATMMPFGSLLNFVDKTVVDPYRRAYRGATAEEFWENGIESAWGELMAKFVDRIPGAGKAPMMYDQITGQPFLSYPGNGPYGLNPLQVAIPILPRGIPTADRTWTNVLNFMGSYTEYTPTQVELNNTEQQALNRMMAKVKLNGLTFHQWVDNFMQRADVRKFMAEGKALAVSDPIRYGLQDEFNQMRADYGRAALAQMMAQNPNLLKRFANKELFNDAVKRNDRDAAAEFLGEIAALERESRRNPPVFSMP